MTATLIRTAGGAWSRTLPQRGPSSWRRPARTAAWSKPADAVCTSEAQINTFLAAYNGSAPAVVEVPVDLLSASSLDITHKAGAENWANRVLIRPPVGQRRAWSAISNACANVVIAGFDYEAASIKGSSTIAGAGRFATFWRMYGPGASFIGISGADDATLLDCVAPDYVVTGGDRCNVKGGADGVKGCARSVIRGCYFGEGRKPVGSAAHLDTIQYTNGGTDGVGIRDAMIADTVVLGADNYPIIASSLAGLWVLDNNYVEPLYYDESDPNADPKASNGTINGGVAPSTTSGIVAVNNTFRGSGNFDHTPVIYSGNTHTGVLTGPDDGTNPLVTVGSLGAPPLPNLAALWPECPVL